MKPITKNKLVIFSLLAMICAAFFSFAPLKGGDSFQIYLNGKLVLDKALYKNKEIQSLQLPQSAATDKIEVYYNHCGRTGTNRSMSVKDDQQKTLKTWQFADGGRNMTVLLKELRDVQRSSKAGKVNLYYSSKELPGGQLLASVSINNRAVATR